MGAQSLRERWRGPGRRMKVVEGMKIKGELEENGGAGRRELHR